MRRVVIDTNLYIDWLNAGRHEAVFFEPGVVKYLSAVVMMELSAGTIAERDRKLLRGVTDTFAKLGRIVTPSTTVYREAGEVLRRLQILRGYHLRRAYSLVSDVLIALSAQSIGATVITQNERDFVAIQDVRPFKLTIVP